MAPGGGCSLARTLTPCPESGNLPILGLATVASITGSVDGVKPVKATLRIQKGPQASQTTLCVKTEVRSWIPVLYL